jgi:hypothetical protein
MPSDIVTRPVLDMMNQMHAMNTMNLMGAMNRMGCEARSMMMRR